MTTLPDYLQSARAREDVSRALTSGKVERDGLLLEVAPCGKWTEIAVLVGRESAHAYFIEQGEKFFVTDWGEGARLFGIRQGVVDVVAAFDLEWADPAVRGAYFEENGYQVICTEAVVSGERMKSSWIADLPDALCRVLLASHRVANLETK
jgi:hypothetical protein